MNREEMIVSLGQLRDQLIRDQAKASAEPVNGVAVQRDHPTMTNRKVGIVQALESMLHMAAEWAETSAQEQVNRESRDRKPAGSQEFFLADIRQMVNDVARELGVDDPWKGE